MTTTTKLLILFLGILVFPQSAYPQVKDYGDPYLNQFFKASEKAKAGDYQGAIAEYTKAIGISATDAAAFVNRGLAKHQLKDYRGAVSDFTKAIEINSSVRTSASDNSYLSGYKRAMADTLDVGAYSSRGLSKDMLEDYRGAIADYTRAIEINAERKEKLGRIYCNRGLVKLRLEEKDGGCLDFSKAGELGYGKAYDHIRIYCK